MKVSHLGVVLGVLVTAACPEQALLTSSTSTGGLAIGGGATAAADHLAFTSQPSAATAGNVIRPAVQVTATDSLGNADTSFAATVTIAIGTNPVGGNLSGTTTATAFRGVAQFGGLIIDKAGTGYTLTATASGATAATSNSFNILSP